MKTNIQSNALRIKYAVILLSIIGCLVSCKSKESEPEQPAPPSQSPLTEKAKDVATFLTDNYAVGDSVFFRRETGDTEGFKVTYNRFSANEDLSEYLLETSMESEKNSFDIRISITEPLKDFIYLDGIFSLNHDSDMKPNIFTTDRGDSITIATNLGKCCTLRRNVGVGFVFQKQLHWDLIPK